MYGSVVVVACEISCLLISVSLHYLLFIILFLPAVIGRLISFSVSRFYIGHLGLLLSSRLPDKDCYA